MHLRSILPSKRNRYRTTKQPQQKPFPQDNSGNTTPQHPSRRFPLHKVYKMWHPQPHSYPNRRQNMYWIPPERKCR